MPDSPLFIAAAIAVIAASIAVVVAVGLKVLRSFRELGTDAERATYKTLHAASRAVILTCAALAVLAGVSFAWGMNWLKNNHRRWQPAALAVFSFGLLLPLSEMIRLHPYEYTHFNHIAGTVRGADSLFMLDYWGLALKQASDQ